MVNLTERQQLIWMHQQFLADNLNQPVPIRTPHVVDINNYLAATGPGRLDMAHGALVPGAYQSRPALPAAEPQSAQGCSDLAVWRVWEFFRHFYSNLFGIIHSHTRQRLLLRVSLDGY